MEFANSVPIPSGNGAESTSDRVCMFSLIDTMYLCLVTHFKAIDSGDQLAGKVRVRSSGGFSGHADIIWGQGDQIWDCSTRFSVPSFCSSANRY